MAGITGTTQITVTAREVDFVTRFEKNWDALRQVLGIMRPIKKAPGTTLRTYTTSLTLESGAVAEGATIPFSQAEITEAYKDDVVISKYAKAVTLEAVQKYGADIAVEKTDEEFLNELQNSVLTQFYTFLNTGSLVGTATTFQAALAKAKGEVLNKFASIRRTVTDVVAFVNVLDFYDYIGAAEITVQTAFGMQYVKDFMGYGTIFLLSASDVARNTVIACPVENIDLYYIDPNDSDFAKLGLTYTVSGVTNLIGFHANGNYTNATGESYALMGLRLWAEYLDGIAKITINSGN